MATKKSSATKSKPKTKTPVKDDYVETTPAKIKLPEAPKYDGKTKFQVSLPEDKSSSNTPRREQQQTLMIGVGVIILMTGVGILYIVLF